MDNEEIKSVALCSSIFYSFQQKKKKKMVIKHKNESQMTNDESLT